MRFALLLVLAGASFGGQDPREIVRRSVANDENNYKLTRNYTFLERNELWEWGSDGQIRNRRDRTYDVTLLEGSPYKRLAERDGKPLAADEEAREQEKLNINIAERQKESTEERARRLEEWEKKREKQREFAAEIPDAFRFRLIGEERYAGRDAWVIDAEPMPGYRPRSSMARVFPHVHGKLWVDKQSYAWLRAEVEVMETISIGFVLARISKGTRATVEQTLVNGEVWMPQHVEFEANARVALFKKLHVGGKIQYRDYRKFQVESHVVAAP